MRVKARSLQTCLDRPGPGILTWFWSLAGGSGRLRTPRELARFMLHPHAEVRDQGSGVSSVTLRLKMFSQVSLVKKKYTNLDFMVHEVHTFWVAK